MGFFSHFYPASFPAPHLASVCACVRACVPAAREAAAWRQVALRELSSRCQRRTRPIAQEHLRGRGTSSQQDCSSTAISVTLTQSEQASSLFSLLLTFTSFSFLVLARVSTFPPSFLPFLSVLADFGVLCLLPRSVLSRLPSFVVTRLLRQVCFLFAFYVLTTCPPFVKGQKWTKGGEP